MAVFTAPLSIPKMANTGIAWASLAGAAVGTTRSQHPQNLKGVKSFFATPAPGVAKKDLIPFRCASEEQPPEQVADPEEDQDHQRDDQRHHADHGGEVRGVVVYSGEARRRPG